MHLSRGGKESIARGEKLIKMGEKILESIASYQKDLTTAAGPLVTELSNTAYEVRSSTSEYADTFAEDSDLNWSTDKDKLDDISDDRSS